jgi:deoxycytidylate deaminase
MKQMAMDAAIAVRLESDLKVKVGACLVRGKRIISVAANKSGGSKKHGYQWSRHAELRAVLRASAIRGADCYVARVSGETGNSGLAKPCRACESVLAEAGIAKVYYTTEEGVEMMRLN